AGTEELLAACDHHEPLEGLDGAAVSEEDRHRRAPHHLERLALRVDPRGPLVAPFADEQRRPLTTESLQQPHWNRLGDAEDGPGLEPLLGEPALRLFLQAP